MYNCETDIRAAEWRRFSRDIVFGCPQRSPFRVIVDPTVGQGSDKRCLLEKAARIGRPFRARSLAAYPRAKARLKPWAVLLDHFMVKNWHQPENPCFRT